MRGLIPAKLRSEGCDAYGARGQSVPGELSLPRAWGWAMNAVATGEAGTYGQRETPKEMGRLPGLGNSM